MNVLSEGEVPMGLGMALAQNTAAMERFAKMDKAGRQAVINGTHKINSKEEMQAYVNNLITS